MRRTSTTWLLALTFCACAGEATPQTSTTSQTSSEGAATSEVVPASPATETTHGIVQWETSSLDTTVRVVGTDHAGREAIVFEFSGKGSDEPGVQIIGESTMSPEELTIVNAFFSDRIRAYELREAPESFVQKDDTGCTACNQGEDNWCSGNSMLCQQTRFCPVDYPPFEERRRCGSPRVCGACISGMFW